MTTHRKGFQPARKVGSAPDNKGFNTYNIASAYGTTLGLGHPVKLNNGAVEQATHGDDVLGVFMGVTYVDTQGDVKITGRFPAGTTSAQPILARVLDDPNATFLVQARMPEGLDKVPAAVVPGKLYAMYLDGVDVATMRAKAEMRVLGESIGTLDIAGNTDLTAIVGITNNDVFSVNVGAGAVNVTITTGMTTVQLLAALNAIADVKADLTAAGFLRIVNLNGGNVVLTNVTGTPLTALGNTAGTYTPTALAAAAMVRVVKVIDADKGIVEVIFSRHLYRDDA